MSATPKSHLEKGSKKQIKERKKKEGGARDIPKKKSKAFGLKRRNCSFFQGRLLRFTSIIMAVSGSLSQL